MRLLPRALLLIGTLFFSGYLLTLLLRNYSSKTISIKHKEVVPPPAQVTSKTSASFDNASIAPSIAPFIKEEIETHIISASNETKQQCCYPFSLKQLDQRFSAQFFDSLDNDSIYVTWTGKEKEDWQMIRSNFMSSGGLSESCAAQWKYTVLEQQRGYYLQYYFAGLKKLNDIVKDDVKDDVDDVPKFKYVESTPGQHRVLQLGDSISMGIWGHLQNIVESRGLNFSVQGAPNNCGPFHVFKTNLSSWLGLCTWDLVQFNVGMHYRSSNMTDYINELIAVVKRIGEHSPSAHIVFALTTPSPFDSNLTMPNITTCKNYNLFHKAGFVSKLNTAAEMGLSRFNVTINDRYSVIQPVLGQYQKSCDIHYTNEGYRFLAEHDLGVLERSLGYFN